MINLNNIKSLQDLHFEMEPAMEEVLSAEDLAMTQMILDTLDEIEELQEQQEMAEIEQLLNDMKQKEQKRLQDEEQKELEQELLEHELKVAMIQIEELSKPNNDECGINNIKEYFTTETGTQIEFDDDMDEFDRRNVQRFLDVRLEE